MAWCGSRCSFLPRWLCAFCCCRDVPVALCCLAPCSYSQLLLQGSSQQTSCAAHSESIFLVWVCKPLYSETSSSQLPWSKWAVSHPDFSGLCPSDSTLREEFLMWILILKCHYILPERQIQLLKLASKGIGTEINFICINICVYIWMLVYFVHRNLVQNALKALHWILSLFISVSMILIKE